MTSCLTSFLSFLALHMKYFRIIFYFFLQQTIFGKNNFFWKFCCTWCHYYIISLLWWSMTRLFFNYFINFKVVVLSWYTFIYCINLSKFISLFFWNFCSFSKKCLWYLSFFLIFWDINLLISFFKISYKLFKQIRLMNCFFYSSLPNFKFSLYVLYNFYNSLY